MGSFVGQANIVLIEPTKYTWREFGLFGRHSRLDPLGIEYIAAICEKNGYFVKVIQQHNESIEEVCALCLELNPKYVGISTLTHTWDVTEEIAKRLKSFNPSIKTVVGGYHASLVPHLCLKSKNIDFVVIGEGEYTFLDIVQTMDDGGEAKNIPGIAYIKNGEIQITNPRERIYSLDSLPFPKRDKSLLENCSVGGAVFPSLGKQKCPAQILYSRGCPYQCSYCCSPSLWKRIVTYRSPQNLIEEIKLLQKNFGTNFLFFSDLTFPINKKKSLELCEEMINKKIDINWFCFSRLDTVDAKLLKKMKEAGCSKIGFGIESFSSKVLRSFKKNVQYKENTFFTLVQNVLELAWSLGITTRVFLILGHTEETEEDILNTKKIIQNLHIDELRIGLFTPFPGLEIYENLEKKKLLRTEDWSQFTTEHDVLKRDKDFNGRLEQIRDEIIAEFYQSDTYRKQVDEKIRKYPYLKDSYKEFFNFLYGKGIKI